MSDAKWNPVIPANLATLAADLRRVHHTGCTLSREWRINQLKAVKRMTEENADALIKALKADLGRPMQEAIQGDVGDVIKECDGALADLDEWMKPEKVTPVVATVAHGNYRYSDPLGVVLIIAPWNFPYALAMNPLIGAIAAGNCAVIKPSEISPQTSSLIASLVPKYLDTNCIVVAEGGVPESTTLLNQQWDLIFYTGSTSVGKIVMQAAAKHLTPVVLELGGKCPVYVNDDANLEIAAKRVAWGKFLNCGQVCLAPDYILVHESVHDKFLGLLKDQVQKMYGDDPKGSASLGRVVNKQHCNRLLKLLDDPASKFKVELGGAEKAKVEERFIPPTILSGVSPKALIMQDEIFGPLCPVLKVPDHNAALQFIKERPKPLALYVFTESKKIAELFLTHTSSGGACVNETVMHIVNHHLPFGGVGPSGMGAYHHKASFDCFSHKKSVLWAGTGSATEISARYAPYSASSIKTLGFIGSIGNLEFKLKPITRHLSFERVLIIILALVLLTRQF